MGAEINTEGYYNNKSYYNSASYYNYGPTAASSAQVYWVFPQTKKHRALLEKPDKVEEDWHEIERQRKYLFEETVREAIGEKIPHKEEAKAKAWNQKVSDWFAEKIKTARGINPDTLADMDAAIIKRERNNALLILLLEA